MTLPHEDVKAKLASIVAILVTPFHPDGQLDENAFRRLTRRVVDAGVPVVAANGNTGEFYSLSQAERHRALELTVESAGPAVVVSGIGFDIRTAIADAADMFANGAHAMMIHHPVHPFTSLAGWVDYHAEIAHAIPEVPFIAYLKDDRVDAATIAAVAERCPNVIGVKYAVNDPARLASLVRSTGDRLTWLCGTAERWAPFFAVGGSVGMTSGLVTIDPNRSLRLQKALDADDFVAAMEEWNDIVELEELRARNRSEFNVSTVKEALAQLGLCAPVVRPPISPLPPEMKAAVSRILTRWGLLDAGSANRSSHY